MGEWCERHLGELADFMSGGTPSRSNATYWDGDIPWISAASLMTTRLVTSDRMVTRAAVGHGTKIAPRGATLLLVRGMSLHHEIRVGQAMRDLAFNQDVKALIARDGVDPTFLLYVLDGRRAELLDLVHAAGHGTGVLATDRLKSLRVAVPELPEQRRIAAVLGSLDELIEAEESAASQADELWRVVVASELGATESVPLSSLARFVNGKNFTKGAGDSGLPVIRTPEVRNGPTVSTVRNDVAAVDDNIARPGDLLFVWSGSLLVSRWRWQPGLVNQHIFKVVPHANVPDWVVLWSIEDLMEDFLGVAADKATTMGHIKRGDLDRLVDVPVRSKWRDLDSKIRPLWDEALEARMHAAELAAARDELLPLLMSGDIRVSEGVAVA